MSIDGGAVVCGGVVQHCSSATQQDADAREGKESVLFLRERNVL
jgi:hypothetical protein